MATGAVADKRKLFELFARTLERGKNAKDAEMMKYLEEAIKLWTQMMMEEHEQDVRCEVNVSKMQKSCDSWLAELLVILSGGDVGEWSSDGTIKTYKKPLIIRQSGPHSASEFETLRSQLALAIQKVSMKDSDISSKDLQIKDLKVRLSDATLQLSKAKINDKTAIISQDIDVLRTQLNKSRIAHDSAMANVSKLEFETSSKDAKIAELVKREELLDQFAAKEHIEVTKLRAELDQVREMVATCRDLIFRTRRRVAADPMPRPEFLTLGGNEPTTVGISFEEAHGVITILNLMVGGPAFNTNKVSKGDQVLAIDGQEGVRLLECQSPECLIAH